VAAQGTTRWIEGTACSSSNRNIRRTISAEVRAGPARPLGPQTIVPGISPFRGNKMLAGAPSSSYGGPRTATASVSIADQIPVNKPRCPVHTTTSMVPCGSQATPNPDAYYEPNSFNGPVQDERFREPAAENLQAPAEPLQHHPATAMDDLPPTWWTCFRLMSGGPKGSQNCFHNTKAAMDGVPVEIVKRWIGSLLQGPT